MDKDVLIEKVKGIRNSYKEKQTIYELLEELGISYKKTNCKKCIDDYLNIIKEELGMIEDASEESRFNSKYTYLKKRSYSWCKFDGTRVIINEHTKEEDIDQFVKTHKGFYRLNTEYK